MAGGIPGDAVRFFTELEQNNERRWWIDHRARWQASVREPMEALCAALAPEFGEAKLFRPHRDVRFSLDKSPYKTHQGAVVARMAGVALYVQISSEGLMTGGGWYESTPARVAAYRDGVLDDAAGGQLSRIVDALGVSGAELGGTQLRSAPRGVDPAHPRIGLLRHRSLLASFDHGTPDWLDTDELVERVRGDWRRFAPLTDWLEVHLGRPAE